jgi:NOL1/NOP2/sun family putative RNA methylase
MVINQNLLPGELGNSIKHILGYYYEQLFSSMLSVIALNPQPDELILDLCASPGSKTTQMAAKMQNKGTIIANDLKIDRISILVSNLEKGAVTNTIVTRNDAIDLCSRFSKSTFPKFDRILLDTPCSGEGTLRSSPKTFIMWNEKVVQKLSRQQKKFFAFAVKCLKVNGTLVYSTCTHAPEENEEIVSFALENFPLKIETISLPLKCRPGITEWKNKKFHDDTKNVCRIYPQDNDSEGFFVSKFTLLEEIK